MNIGWLLHTEFQLLTEVSDKRASVSMKPVCVGHGDRGGVEGPGEGHPVPGAVTKVCPGGMLPRGG